jgi:hypothetical protein
MRVNIRNLYISGKGKISQLNIWSTNLEDSSVSLPDVMSKFKSCSLERTGDILSWKKFENIHSETTFKQIPSECDGNEISSYLCKSFYKKNVMKEL